MTTFPCTNLIYVSFMYCVYKLLLFVFYCQDSFCTVPTIIIMTSSIYTEEL
jgi:hypothetical protein